MHTDAIGTRRLKPATTRSEDRRHPWRAADKTAPGAASPTWREKTAVAGASGRGRCALNAAAYMSAAAVYMSNVAAYMSNAAVYMSNVAEDMSAAAVYMSNVAAYMSNVAFYM
jgi:hypothetical protein